MKEYTRPSCTVIKFSAGNVITASGEGKEPDGYIKDYSDQSGVRLRQIEYGDVFAFSE